MCAASAPGHCRLRIFTKLASTPGPRSTYRGKVGLKVGGNSEILSENKNENLLITHLHPSPGQNDRNEVSTQKKVKKFLHHNQHTKNLPFLTFFLKTTPFYSFPTHMYTPAPSNRYTHISGIKKINRRTSIRLFQ